MRIKTRLRTINNSQAITAASGKVSDIIIIALFTLLIVFVLAAYFSTTSKTSQLENRTLEQFVAPTMESFFDKTFQDQLNTAASDQFPLRETWIICRSFIMRNMIRCAYLPLGDEAIPSSDSNTVMIWNNGDGESLLYAPQSYSTTLVKAIDQRIKEYHDILDACPDLNLNVFYVEMPINSVYSPLYPYYSQAAGTRYWDYFKEHASGIHFAEMAITSQNDILSNFFRSDHHWNIFGAWKGYQLIYDMMKTKYPEMSAKKQAMDFEKVEEIGALHGSLARLAAYKAISDDIYDVILDEIEPYETYISEKAAARGWREVDKAKWRIQPSDIYMNRYGRYFGSDNGLVEYRFENNSDRNLLIVSSSLSQTIEYVIASHYAHTFVVDIRNYSEATNETFDLVDFVQKNDIQDALILGDNSVCFTHLSWALTPELRH